MKFKQTVYQQNKVEIISEFKLIASGKLRHGRVERLKRPPQRMQRSFLMTQKDPDKGFHKDMIRHISLKYFWNIHPKNHVTFLGP